MKTQLSTLLAAAMLLLTSAAAAPFKAKERPFTAEINGLGVGVPCGVVQDATGTATHFGRNVQTGTYCGLEFVGPGLLHLAGEGTQTAANGDGITFSFDEIVDFNTVPFTAEGTFIITGGGGRFTGATGGGTFHTVGTLVGETFDLNIKYLGTISY